MILAIHPRADALQREIARHLDQEVGDEEQARRKAEHRRREPEILVHLQRGEADVYPVEQGEEVADHQERHEPEDDPAHGRFFECVRSFFRDVHVLSSPVLQNGLA